MKKFIAPIALTPGEPAGIGPDIVIQLAQEKLDIPIVIIADPKLLYDRARQLALPIQLNIIDEFDQAISQPAKFLNVLPVKLNHAVVPGQLQPENAAYVLDTLRIAATACLEKKASAVITGPVNKAVINNAGQAFLGHTHFFAEITNTKQVVMLFVSKKLKLALVTDHLPLKAVSKHITKQRVTAVVRILHTALKKQFFCKNPKITLCGLNPHAGENGHLGHEEQKIIIPVIEKLRKQGLNLEGPVSADSAFMPNIMDHTDAIVAMYHDQGLPVLKHMDFGHSVNITLGLPFLRTSVDHGTAQALAGTGKADPSSLRQVLLTTIDLIHGSYGSST